MESNAEFVTVAEAAKELGLGESTVWLLMKQKGITRYRIPGQGKRTFLSRADLPRFKEPIAVKAEQTGKAAA